ncbi:MAG: cyclic nucleotide-binding domain-containing protein, partial [Holophagales bacterium]|nr:cyclic nucleotide-binding domain-containing protein [Holophagales bacterium]
MEVIREVLQKCEMFAGLDDTDLDVLASVAQRKNLPSGAWLFKQGEARRACFIVAEGAVEVTRDTGECLEQLIVLRPGGAAGEASLLHANAHTASAQAMMPTSIIEIERELLRKTLADNGNTAVQVLTRVATVLNRRLLYTGGGQSGQGQFYDSGAVRSESDLLGTANVPEDALFGVQTLRALENFPITGIPLSPFPALVRALA